MTHIKDLNLAVIKGVGPARLRRHLERLVNDDVIGLEGARKVFRDAYDMELEAIKIKRPKKWHGVVLWAIFVAIAVGLCIVPIIWR